MSVFGGIDLDEHVYVFSSVNNSPDGSDISIASTYFSALDASDPTLPTGSNQSECLSPAMVKQLLDVLPPRTEGYPWIHVYNSLKDGFCLSTLYRKMLPWTEIFSPILLIIKDMKGQVFGAVVSEALHLSDHYYGTADACFLFKFTAKEDDDKKHLYRKNSVEAGAEDAGKENDGLLLKCYHWTNKNSYFVDSTKDFISIGGGNGKSGLWVDGDLNLGRSQNCETFENEPLAGEDEEFKIKTIEVFGFHV